MPKSTGEMMDVMAGHASGDVIECREEHGPTDGWTVADNPVWDWYQMDYRIKGEESCELTRRVEVLELMVDYLNRNAALWKNVPESKKSNVRMEGCNNGQV